MCKWDFLGLFFVHLFGRDGQVGGKWYGEEMGRRGAIHGWLLISVAGRTLKSSVSVARLQ